MVECSVTDCSKRAVARGWCNTHWTQWRRSTKDFVPIYGRVEERFWSKVDRSGGPQACWPWLGTLERSGYGQFFDPNHEPRLAKAHRYAYELLVGPVPGGLDLDHACHTRDEQCNLKSACPHRRCVNPAHLEPVSERENLLRSRNHMADQAKRTHCVHGHELSGENLVMRSDGGRRCRTCKNAGARRRYREAGEP